MLFTSWIALCGWNKLTASLLRAIYSIHAMQFKPHARLPSFLLGSFHQALRVSLECHTMSSPVGPTHPPQLQMQLRHSTISTQPWRSHGAEGLSSCTHDLCCCVALIWLPLHLRLGQRAALGPCTIAFTPQTVPVVHGPLPLTSHAHVGWGTPSEGLWQRWFSLIMDRHQLTKPCHNLAKPGKTSFIGRGLSENQALKDKVSPNSPHLVYFRIQEEHKWLHISVEVLLPRPQYQHSSAKKRGQRATTTLTFPRYSTWDYFVPSWKGDEKGYSAMRTALLSVCLAEGAREMCPKCIIAVTMGLLFCAVREMVFGKIYVWSPPKSTLNAAVRQESLPWQGTPTVNLFDFKIVCLVLSESD